MAVGSVDGRVNPSDLGTKVSASAARLKALLFMRNVVDSSGDFFVPVGQPEYEQLMTKFENAKQSMHVRSLMNKSLRNGGLTNPSICLLLLNMLSTAAASAGFRCSRALCTRSAARNLNKIRTFATLCEPEYAVCKYPHVLHGILFDQNKGHEIILTFITPPEMVLTAYISHELLSAINLRSWQLENLRETLYLLSPWLQLKAHIMVPKTTLKKTVTHTHTIAMNIHTAAHSRPTDCTSLSGSLA